LDFTGLKKKSGTQSIDRNIARWNGIAGLKCLLAVPTAIPVAPWQQLSGEEDWSRGIFLFLLDMACIRFKEKR
jgi:hypothetical protein